MRVLLDECVNPRLRVAFPGAEVKTVAEMGWRSLTNGRLLREAASSSFDVFVTLDQNLEFQNATGSFALGVLVLNTRFNDLATYRPHFAAIRDAALKCRPGQVMQVQVT